MANNGQMDPGAQATGEDTLAPALSDDATGAAGETDAGAATDEVDALLAQYDGDPRAVAQALLEETARNDALDGRLTALEQRPAAPGQEAASGPKAPTAEDLKVAAQEGMIALHESDYGKDNPDVVKLLIKAFGPTIEWIAQQKVEGLQQAIETRLKERFLEDQDPTEVQRFEAWRKKRDTRAEFEMWKRAQLAGKAGPGGPRPLKPGTVNIGAAQRAARSGGSITGIAGHASSPKGKESAQMALARKHGLIDEVTPGTTG